MSMAAERLDAVHGAVRQAARDVDREPDDVALIAVSKTVAADGIRPVLDAGQRLFGENYVQESQAKWPALREAYPDVELHFVGPLQSNKAADAVALFDVVHSVDRSSVAAALARARDKLGRVPRLICQVNTGREAQKGGVLPEAADAFLAECRQRYELAIEGLMCVPPFDQAPSPHFALLGTIARRNGLATLSMGMSADFAAAIQLGATHVRIGTAIFGERAKPAA